MLVWQLTFSWWKWCEFVSSYIVLSFSKKKILTIFSEKWRYDVLFAPSFVYFIFFFVFFTRLLELFYDIFNVQRLSTERAVNMYVVCLIE